MTNGRPPRPARCWRKSTGPRDPSLMARAHSNSSGESTTNPTPAPRTSSARFHHGIGQISNGCNALPGGRFWSFCSFNSRFTFDGAFAAVAVARFAGGSAGQHLRPVGRIVEIVHCGRGAIGARGAQIIQKLTRPGGTGVGQQGAQSARLKPPTSSILRARAARAAATPARSP